jgi:hypothetical protein
MSFDHEPLAHGSSSSGFGGAGPAAGKRTLTDRLPERARDRPASPAADGGATATHDAAAPGWSDVMSSDLSFVDSLIAEPIEGDPVPGYPLAPPRVYTDEDRNAMSLALMQRNKHNARQVSEFLGNYVHSALTLVTPFVLGEKAEKKALPALIKHVFAHLAGHVIGAATGMGAAAVGAKEVLKHVIELASSTTSSIVIDKGISSKDSFKDPEALERLIENMGKDVGGVVATAMTSFTEAAARTHHWLTTARLPQLDRFRIPFAFTAPSSDAIRAVVAGSIAGSFHRREHFRGWHSASDWYEADDVEHDDDNVVVMQLGLAGDAPLVHAARFETRSDVLSAAIAGKATIGMLPAVALHGTIEAPDQQVPAARRVLTAAYGAAPTMAEIEALLAHLGSTAPAMVFTRNRRGEFLTLGGGLAERLIMYQFASGDHGLMLLAGALTFTDSDPLGERTTLHRLEPAEMARALTARLDEHDRQHNGAQAFVAARLGAVPVGHGRKRLAPMPR